VLRAFASNASLMSAFVTGLKSVEAAILASAYRMAVLRAARQIGAELAILPSTCPWGWTEILDKHFLPPK
jgi:hypothetical protein